MGFVECMKGSLGKIVSVNVWCSVGETFPLQCFESFDEALNPKPKPSPLHPAAQSGPHPYSCDVWWTQTETELGFRIYSQV